MNDLNKRTTHKWKGYSWWNVYSFEQILVTCFVSRIDVNINCSHFITTANIQCGQKLRCCTRYLIKIILSIVFHHCREKNWMLMKCTHKHWNHETTKYVKLKKKIGHKIDLGWRRIPLVITKVEEDVNEENFKFILNTKSQHHLVKERERKGREMTLINFESADAAGFYIEHLIVHLIYFVEPNECIINMSYLIVPFSLFVFLEPFFSSYLRLVRYSQNIMVPFSLIFEECIFLFAH